MKKYETIIESAGARALITSESDELITSLKNSEFLPRYIPGYKFSDNSDQIDCSLELSTGEKSFSINYQKSFYSNTEYDDRDVVSLIEFLLERARQTKGVYCIHSSSAVVNNGLVIFWGGASGMGKTRLALGLNQTKHAQFFSDEKTLINLSTNKAVGGIPFAYLSKPFLKDKYGESEFYDVVKPSGEFDIRLFVYPHIDESSTELYSERWENKKFDWHLYEELSRKIRGTSRRFFNNSAPVLSIDTMEIAKRRSDEIKVYIDKIPCYYLRGTEKQICDHIISMCEGNN